MVRSDDPLSTTMISSQQRRLSMARTICLSSFRVMIVADIFISRSLFHGSEGKTCQEDESGDQSEAFANRTRIRVIVNRRVAPGERIQHNSPGNPAPIAETEPVSDPQNNQRRDCEPRN